MSFTDTVRVQSGSYNSHSANLAKDNIQCSLYSVSTQYIRNYSANIVYVIIPYSGLFSWVEIFVKNSRGR